MQSQHEIILDRTRKTRGLLDRSSPFIELRILALSGLLQQAIRAQDGLEPKPAQVLVAGPSMYISAPDWLDDVV
jgi:hypothetical protein